MRLTRVHIHNFRCFDKETFDLSDRVILVQGKNGAGKSSFLEALHYLCYLRSFRTPCAKDLIRFGQDSFFLKVQFSSGGSQPVNHELQVGFTPQKKSVKLNKKSIQSFKELMDHYRVVTLTEDDLFLINGSPDSRRQFIDQAVLLEGQQYAAQVKDFRRVLQNRNSLLQNRFSKKESCDLWTSQLWEKSRGIQLQRVKLLQIFEDRVNELLKQGFDEKLTVSLGYKTKNDDRELSFDGFMDRCIQKDLLSTERRYGRSLFGAHLDDVVINFQERGSKRYASRGQQKLVVMLLKIAQLHSLEAQRGLAVLLLDDFMTDFDERRVDSLVNLLAQLPNQLIFTSPSKGALLNDLVGRLGSQSIKLTV